MTSHNMKLIICMMLSLLWTSTARAQPGAAMLAQDKLGCSQCSPPQDQQRAQKLFLEARRLLEKERYADAAALYEQALTHWDNPLIRYALARALYLQQRFIEARAHLDEVLTYGAECFDPRMWDSVQKLAVFLQERLSDMGQIEVLCREPGALVDLDGMPGFTCSAPMDEDPTTCAEPVVRVQIQNGWAITHLGEARRLVHPGTYRVTASKPGHDTVSKSVPVSAGRESRVAIDIAVAARAKSPAWELASGLLMIGAGASTITVGAVLHSSARSTTQGARISYVIGGATAVAGLALLAIHYSDGPSSETRDRGGITVTPLITGDTAGVALDFDF